MNAYSHFTDPTQKNEVSINLSCALCVERFIKIHTNQ